MMSVTEIIDRVRAAMDRNAADAERRAARAAAYTGPERRRAPRIAIVDDRQQAERLAQQGAKDDQP